MNAAEQSVSTLCVFLLVCVLQVSGDGSRASADQPAAPGESERGVAHIVPRYLRCEYLVNPLGIDEVRPRVSWELESIWPGERNQKQVAYQVAVATAKSNLDSGKFDLWDSGKVNSDQTSQIAYAGLPLKSGMECWWKVRVWDEQGHVSRWSEPAYWTMGLLDESEWRGEWIQEHARLNFERCKWIWTDEGRPRRETAAGIRYFRCTFSIPEGPNILNAPILIAADDRFTLFVNGQEVGRSGDEAESWREPRIFDIEGYLVSGANLIAVAAENMSPGPAALAAKVVIELSDFKQIVLTTDASWKVSDREQETWQEIEFDDKSWDSATEVAHVGELGTPWGVPGRGDDLILSPPPYFRKVFSIRKPVDRAVLYATALGIYEIHINGRRIGNDFFTPGWSDYRKRVYYNTYEVTDVLQPGLNAIGVILADGWYAGYLAWGHIRNRYNGGPKLLLQLEVYYSDGSTETVSTNASWKYSHGPIREADFLMGETYDARREMQGWSTADFDDSNWDNVVIAGQPGVKIEAYPGVTVRKTQEIPAKTVSEPNPGVYVFDLGQNMVGWARLKVRGEAGRKITLRFAEVLNADGTVYTENLRGARAMDTYYLKGEGKEVWEPRFTFHGFRYIEVTGYPCRPGADAIAGVVVHSDMPRAGRFVCSSELVNKLVDNIIWGQRGNYLEVPTDCPQRDERLGWTGDAHIFMRAGCYNFDTAAFFTKWLVDLKDSQNNEGAYAHVAPDVEGVGYGSPAWSDAGIICPYTMYQVYGDTRIIEQHYDSMARYIEYLRKNSENLLRPAYGYGDWLSLNADTPKEVLATAYFAYVSKLMARMARVIGRDNDANKYNKLSDDISSAFAKAFVSRNGRVKGDTQTGYSLALDIGLIPENLRSATFRNLVRDLMIRGWHFSTGFPGTRHLFPVLAKFGRNDIAYRLVLNDTFPSWGYEIKHGATTIWERWDGWTEEFGFQNPGMNSFNHYAFGSVGAWIFSSVAGIDTDGAGFKKILIRPQLGGGLTQVKAEYHSIHGWIECEWHIENDTLTLRVRIPVNTTATLFIPAVDPAKVSESGKPAYQADGVTFLRKENGVAVFRLGSGHYKFASREAL